MFIKYKLSSTLHCTKFSLAQSNNFRQYELDLFKVSQRTNEKLQGNISEDFYYKEMKFNRKVK